MIVCEGIVCALLMPCSAFWLLCLSGCKQHFCSVCMGHVVVVMHLFSDYIKPLCTNHRRFVPKGIVHSIQMTKNKIRIHEHIEKNELECEQKNKECDINSVYTVPEIVTILTIVCLGAHEHVTA